MNQIYFSEYRKDFSRKFQILERLTIEMNEYFMKDFDNSPIMNSFRNYPKDLKIIVNQKTYMIMQFVYDSIRKNTKNQTPLNEIILKVDNDDIFSRIIDLINGKVVHLTFKDSLLFRAMCKDLNFMVIYDFFDKEGVERSINMSISPISLVQYLTAQPKNFSIVTKKNTYKCNKIAASVSQVILNVIQLDNSIDSFSYDFEDENNEFKIISDYLNFENIEIMPENIEIITKFANDLKFETLIKILNRISDQQKNYDEVLNQNQKEIDFVDDLFDVLTTQNEQESVNYIINSSWLSNDELQKELIGSLISLIFSSPKFVIKVAKIFSILFEQIENIQKSDDDHIDLDNVDLKLLKNFILRRVIDSADDSHFGPFIYELIKLNFINLPKINENNNSNNNENESSKNNSNPNENDNSKSDMDSNENDNSKSDMNSNENDNSKSDMDSKENGNSKSDPNSNENEDVVADDKINGSNVDDDSDLLLRCLSNQYTAIWILPELDEIIQGLPNYFDSLKENDSVSYKHFLSSEYKENNWEKIRKYRETKQSPEPIAIAIARDDVDQFQKLLYLPHEDEFEKPKLFVESRKTTGFQRKRLQKIHRTMSKSNDENDKFNNNIPFFEFDLYSESTFIDYAAFHGSIRCFKFLLLGGATVTDLTFDAAIEGGNIEIVRITEQKLNEGDDDSFYNGKIMSNKNTWSDMVENYKITPFSHFRRSLVMHPNGLERAIYNHNNDIFDWIFENKKINRSELANLLQMASLSNNLHVISCIFNNEQPLISYETICRSVLKSISYSASLGFTSCVKLLINIFGIDNFKTFSNEYEIICGSYAFDIVDIFKLTWFKENDFQLLINLCRNNSVSIFKYCYNKESNNECYEYLINFAIKNSNDEIFKFLFDQINESKNNIQKEILYKKLLKNSVKCNCLPIFKYLFSTIKDESKFSQTLTKCLIIAAKNGYEDIFQYILDYNKNCSHDQFANEILNNLFGIIQSGSIKIIKMIIQFIDNENYIKMMMFDLLFKESDKIIKHDFDGVKSVSTFAFTRKTKSLKSIFSIKNVTEFLISYVDEVTPEFLVAATKIGNIDAVKAIVKRNSSYDFLNQVFHPSGNALSIACNNESNEIAKFLLNSCPEIDPSVGFPKNGQYLTPLIISVSKQNFELIRAIIAFQKANKKNEKISLNRDDNDNSDPLLKEIQMAISSIFTGRFEINRKFEEIISFLISSVDGININEIYCDESPLLSLLVDDNLFGTFNHVLSLPNVNPNVFDYRIKETPLIKAIKEGQIKIVMALLNHKDIDINMEAYYHITALSMAVFCNNIDVVKLLVKNEKLKVDNLNYSVSLYHAIKNNYIECIELLLSRPECNVNELIPSLYKEDFNKKAIRRDNGRLLINPVVNNNLNQMMKYIKLNIYILEQESRYHSNSIIQAAAASDNIEIVKDIVNHPRFVPKKSTLSLAIFESIKKSNTEIFDLLMNLYLKLDKDVDIFKFYDLCFNTIVVVASASNNIDFMNQIPNFIKKNEENFSSFYNNQLAFVVAPSIEMMRLIIDTLPGVDLSKPLENGSNYLTALIDFYLSPSYSIGKDQEKNERAPNSDLFINIIRDKISFILLNSNLKLTTKDKNGFSFITKATSRSHCIYYLQMTSMIYSKFTPLNTNQEKLFLIDEQTKMNPLHMVCSNIQLMSFSSPIKGKLQQLSTNNFYECEDDFDILVNLAIIENFKSAVCMSEGYEFIQIFEMNSNFNDQNNRMNFIDDDINAVDVLNQTPIIKAILHLNIHFANYMFSELNANIDIVDVFGNTFVDYLLIIIDYIVDSFQRVAGTTTSADYRSIIKERSNRKSDGENDRELCSLIFDDLLKYFSNEDWNWNKVDANRIVNIIIKLSNYLVQPKKSD